MSLSDDVASSLSQSADEELLFEEEGVEGDEEGSDDSYVPGSQSESRVEYFCAGGWGDLNPSSSLPLPPNYLGSQSESKI